MKSVKMPSGATLKISPAPFVDAYALYQAVLVELRGVTVTETEFTGNLLKNILCAGFGSKAIETRLWTCLARCTYNDGVSGDLKITLDTFEPVERRGDYVKVCVEVARENVAPFASSLYAEYTNAIATADGTRA